MRFLLVVGLCAGCAGPVVSKVKVTPPEPLPAPVETPEPVSEPAKDGDGDGLVGEADRCPEAPETRNGHDDGDGCPDEAPAFRLADDEVVYLGEITFAAGGRLTQESAATLDGIAEVMQKHPEIDLLEVGVHVVGDRPADADQVTRLRASTVVDALVERGVASSRLQATGYGAKCRIGGSKKGLRIDLKVLEKSGEKTAVTRGCSK